MLLAGLLFVSTYFSNIGTRFLIPMVPFVSLALALAIANLPWLLFPLVAANLIACWPGMYLTYCGPGPGGSRAYPSRPRCACNPRTTI